MTAFAFHYAGGLFEKKGVVVSTPRGGHGRDACRGDTLSIVETLRVVFYFIWLRPLHDNSMCPRSDLISLIIAYRENMTKKKTVAESATRGTAGPSLSPCPSPRPRRPRPMQSTDQCLCLVLLSSLCSAPRTENH